MRLFVVLLGMTLTAEFAAARPVYQQVYNNCPQFWFSFNERCFKYMATEMTWAEAELYCVTQDANLVSIHSEEEHRYVTAMIRQTDLDTKATWIGLSDVHKEDAWMWSDGSRVDYTNWHEGEPNNADGGENCVNTNSVADLKWNDWKCDHKNNFVCATRKVW